MKQFTTKKGFHELPAILAVLAILGVLGYYAYNNYFDTPERVYSQMTSKMQNLKKAHIEAETTVNLGGVKSLMDIFVGALNPEVSGFKFSGDFDVTNSESPKYRLSTEFSQFTRDAFDIETRTVDGQNYYLIDYVSGIQSTGDLKYYPESWFTQKTKPEIDPSLTERLKNMTPVQEALVNITELPEENIGKAVTYHFALELDNQAFSRNVEKIIEELEIEFENRETLNLVDDLKVTKAEVWIGKSDKYLYKALFEFESEMNGSTVRMTSNINFSEFENIEDITAPEEFMEIDFDPEEVATERMTPRDRSRMIQINLIANAVREFYKNNGVLPDTDGDPNSFSYPASPTCISPYQKNCFRLTEAGFETTDDFISPRYIKNFIYELYEEYGHESFMTYHRDGKVYVTAQGDIGGEFKTERDLE